MWSICVCVCVFAVLATFLTTHIFLLCNYHCTDVCVSVCVQCVCRELAHAHVAMPLQSQSALSCCFHSSSESQHSQPRSLPGFTLLVPARSDSLPTFFLSLRESEQDWRHFSVPLTFIHSDGVDQRTRNTRTQKVRSIFLPHHIHKWTLAECGPLRPKCWSIC